ncbi:YvcK family protein [Serpentinicella sp. ANB-PHB4]|uniref:gluconeogenesis factor YvcK family protein n=1 Tax=Serpentinicella sp. ANB-PHB4 TaxID=3074076 RepID=UPI00285450F4|nr:YvcK family protein [Serpentinicella sp. ANB-PHB4]MDR5659376.1 YvcK family protein [Serpentinicella sp. ANB-PHB4]
MRLIDWLKPGLQLKRWVLLGLLGIILVAYAASYYIMLLNIPLESQMAIGILILGLGIIYFSLKFGLNSLLKNISFLGSLTKPLDKKNVNKQVYDKRILSKGPKIVTIGGGTGSSVLLRGLKHFTTNITAIVTVADDGGGSGVLREDLGMLPPGDIRSCILALAEMEPTMEKLLQYRFQEGSLKGQSFGNLLIAAMDGTSDSFEEAIKKINDVFAVSGNVYPVTLENLTLFGKLENGMIIQGESKIPTTSITENSPIESVYIEPKDASALKEAISAIKDADIVIMGPGSLYTSILPNLLVEGICEALASKRGKLVYIPNIMTQPGETDNYSIIDHVNAIWKHCPGIPFDYVIANTGKAAEKTEDKYHDEGASFVKVTDNDKKKLKDYNIMLLEDDFVEVKNQYIRHDAVKLSKTILDLFL